MYIYLYTYIYIYICIYVYMYIYIYVHICTGHSMIGRVLIFEKNHLDIAVEVEQHAVAQYVFYTCTHICRDIYTYVLTRVF